MPGNAIGIRLPRPKNRVLHAEIQINEQEGLYTLNVNVIYPGPLDERAPIVGDMQKFLEEAVNKLNQK